MWGAIASIGGALLGSSSSSDAADAQAASTAAAVAENRRQYDLTRQDYAPYRNVGTNALRRLAALYGLSDGTTGGTQTEADIRASLTPKYTTAAVPASWGVLTNSGGGGRDAGPEFGMIPGRDASVDQAGLDAAVAAQLQAQASGKPQTYNDGLDGPIQMDPGYQFGLSEGQRAIDRKTAAAGGRVSGAAIKAANRYATDYATTGYNAAYQRRQDSINRLASLANIGQTSTGASAQAGESAARANANLIDGMGAVNSAAALNQGNIWRNAINQVGANWANPRSYGTPGYWPSDMGQSWNYDK